MKVNRAIELARHVAVQLKSQSSHEAYLAILLCIASLERHRDRDYLSYMSIHEKLPGEN